MYYLFIFLMHIFFQMFLETRIVELESALELAQKNELRDKQTINKLTKQLNRVSSFVNNTLTRKTAKS